jgi:hypothetical protein
MLFLPAGCAMKAGGVTLGDARKNEIVTEKLEWTSWENAQRSADLASRPILLYVIGKAREGQEFDPSLFDNESVKAICHDVSCVRLNEGSTETVFSNKRGVTLLLPTGELLSQFPTTPGKDNFVSAIRRAINLSQPRRSEEPKPISNKAGK